MNEKDQKIDFLIHWSKHEYSDNILIGYKTKQKLIHTVQSKTWMKKSKSIRNSGKNENKNIH